MRKADLLFLTSITVMSCMFIYAMQVRNLALFGISEAGAVISIVAYAIYNKCNVKGE